MTPYPHPAAALAVFQQRLSEDIGVDNTTYTLTCGTPLPSDVALQGSDCSAWTARYNTAVDMEATGALIGEVDAYLYNRLALAALQLPAATFMPYLKASFSTVADLIPEINARSGLNLDVTDILAHGLDSCDCACGPVGVLLEASQTSLLFIGSFPIYVWGSAVALNDAVTTIYLGKLPLPALTSP